MKTPEPQERQLSLFPSGPESYKVKKVIKRNGRVVAFDREKITNAVYKAARSVGGKNRDQAASLSLAVLRAMNALYPEDAVPSVEEIQDLIEKVLIENGHAKTAKAYILYRAERARVREKKDVIIAAEDNIPYKLLWKAHAWNVDHECDSVEKLNRQLRDGRWPSLVEACERQYHDEIQKTAEALLRRKEDVRLLIVAGPSSSGKTTATLKIGERLKQQGLSFVLMNLDHYFKNLDQHPRDDYGDHDYESPHALELDMINDHLRSLLQGKAIRMPYYDFKTGLRKDSATPFKLKKGDIILIDSLHGLYDKMTESVAAGQKFKFYIESLCQIKDRAGEFVRWTDLRLLRRMIRDSWHRSHDPEKTVGHWHYVRRSEKKYIVPFINTVDRVFNGSLGYELPVYKNLLARHFPAILRKFKNDPQRADAHLRAQRVHNLLESLEKFPDLDAVPGNSPLREFIGGSIYKY